MPKKTKQKLEKQEVAESSEVLEVVDGDEEKGKEDYSGLIKQCRSEWEQGWWHLKPKWDEWALRLKLYNNQKRDKESVGDTLLFAVFQTVLSSLYEDRLDVEFAPRETGDDEIAENLTISAEHDYDLMEKDEVDYEWDWEAMFFGRGLLCTMEFDRGTMTPAPVIWNAMTVVRDPEAGSVNGDRKGRGKSRFIYREARYTMQDFKDNEAYFNYENLKASGTNDTKSPIDEYLRLTAEAAGLADIQKHSNIEGDNASYRVREGFTRHNGKLVFVTLADDGAQVIRYDVLERNTIPITDRVLFPMPNNWDSVSIPDLVEDKQRARAVALNLSLKEVKAGLHPMYLFDKTKVDEKTDFNFGFNKFIGVKGNPNNAVIPLMKDRVKQDVSFIMELLQQGSDKATGTPETRQGVRPNSGGTATRDALIAQGSESRYSLAARIFGWSEKRFWKEWYLALDEHMTEKGIDEKMARIVGALGASWRRFSKEDLVTKGIAPDIKIVSRRVAETKRFNEANLFRDYIKMASSSQEIQLTYALRHYGKLIGIKTDIIEQMLPPSIEELRAEDENKLIASGSKAIILPEDDHYMHMHIHNKLAESAEKRAHLNAHKKALVLQKMRPDMVPMPMRPEQGQMPDQQLPRPERSVVSPRELPTKM